MSVEYIHIPTPVAVFGSDVIVPAEWTCPSINPRLGRLAVSDQLHRGSVRYVMVSLVVTAYTDIIECG